MAYEELSDDELDDLVHDRKGDEAVAINNDGREAQLVCLNRRAEVTVTSTQIHQCE